MQPHRRFSDLENVFGITWQELADLEPRLRELLWKAREAGCACRQWSDVDRAFAPIRTALTDLVGFAGANRCHPVLGGAAAYHVAYLKLRDAVVGLLRYRATSAPETPETSADARAAELAAAAYASM